MFFCNGPCRPLGFDVAGQHFQDFAKGQVGVADAGVGIAVPAGHDQVSMGLLGTPGEFLDQGRLATTCFTRHEHYPALTRQRARRGARTRDEFRSSARAATKAAAKADRPSGTALAVADRLIQAMTASGAYRLKEHELKRLERVIFKDMGQPSKPGLINPEWIGKDAAAILGAIGVTLDSSIRLLVAEVPKEHPLVWTEQMMPVMPVVRVKDVDVAIDLLPLPLMINAFEAALEARVPLVSTNYGAPIRRLHQAAAAAGVALMPECGLDPGIDLIICGHAARQFDRCFCNS